MMESQNRGKPGLAILIASKGQSSPSGDGYGIKSGSESDRPPYGSDKEEEFKSRLTDVMGEFEGAGSARDKAMALKSFIKMVLNYKESMGISHNPGYHGPKKY